MRDYWEQQHQPWRVLVAADDDDDVLFANYEPTTVDPGAWGWVIPIITCFVFVQLLPLCVALQQEKQRSRQRRQAADMEEPSNKRDSETEEEEEEEEEERNADGARPKRLDWLRRLFVRRPRRQGLLSIHRIIAAANVVVTAFASCGGTPKTQEKRTTIMDPTIEDDISEQQQQQQQQQQTTMTVTETTEATTMMTTTTPTTTTATPLVDHWSSSHALRLARSMDSEDEEQPPTEDCNTTAANNSNTTVNPDLATAPSGSGRKNPLLHLSWFLPPQEVSPVGLPQTLLAIDMLSFNAHNIDPASTSSSCSIEDPPPPSPNSSMDSSCASSQPEEAPSSTVVADSTPIPPQQHPSTNEKALPTTIDLTCGPRPWFTYYLSQGFYNKLRKSARWDRELRRITKLFVPYVLNECCYDLFYFLEVVVIGNLFGTTALSAYLAVSFVVSLATMFNLGLMSSLTVLCSQAIGAKNRVLVGKFVQLAILNNLLTLVPITAILWDRVDKIVLLLGYNEETASVAEDYARFSLLSYIFTASDTANNYVLDVSGKERYASAVGCVYSALMFLVPLLVGTIMTEPQLWMVSAIQWFVAMGIAFFNIYVILYYKWFSDGIWDGMVGSFAFTDLQAVRVFYRTSLPLALGYIVEYSEWEVLFVFAASQGPAEAAVWGLLGTVWGISENIVLSLGGAAEVRVGQLVGSRRGALARHSAHKSLFWGGFLSCLVALFIFLLRHQIAGWLTTNATLRELTTSALPIVCVSMVTLNFGSMSWSILSAQGRTFLATSTTLVGSIVATLPLASVATFVFNLNLEGLLATVVIGYGFSGFLNSYWMIVSDWEALARSVSKRHHQNNDDETVDLYSEYYWDELPREGIEAATLLGYTEKSWDNSEKLELFAVDWVDLPILVREAALKIGFNESNWKVCR